MNEEKVRRADRLNMCNVEWWGADNRVVWTTLILVKMRNGVVLGWRHQEAEENSCFDRMMKTRRGLAGSCLRKSSCATGNEGFGLRPGKNNLLLGCVEQAVDTNAPSSLAIPLQ